MLFNSLTFIVFFSVVLALYNAPFSWRSKKVILLIASYTFYAAWSPPFVVLLWISTAVDWKVAQWIHVSSDVRRRRMFLMMSLLTNLGILGFFKYGGFLTENFSAAIANLGIVYDAPDWNVILPIGISFYTFQTMAYSLDVYLKRAKPTKSLLDFSLFVTFFPQLVAGPIVRPSQLVPQFATPKRANSQQLCWGLGLMTIGLFQKVVLADSFLAPAVDPVFSSQSGLPALDAWVGVLSFSGQIFFDFAGYSLIAIGSALCLGFALPNNFLSPYAAVGFSDFWRRWHISLSTWLRDYLYIPLGGNRGSSVRIYINLSITMLLGGLWHGANWNFVIWGGLHALYLAIERLLRENIQERSWFMSIWFTLAMGLATYFLINITWVFFRAHEFSQAIMILQSMFGMTENPQKVLYMNEIIPSIIIIIGMVATHWMMRLRSFENMIGSTPLWLIGSLWSLMLFILIITQGSDSAFIYFQF